MELKLEPAERLERARRLRAGIRALVRRFSFSERANVECCGMTVAQWAALEVLQAEGPLRLGDLGARLGIAPSTLTRNLDRLEERGLVARVEDPEDGRAFRVTLTGEGRNAGARVTRMEEEFAGTILDRLPPGRQADLVDSLEEMLVAVREATESCCHGVFDPWMKAFPRAEAREGRRG
jgi:DNA-binding MarR family transcriptional regulator